MSHSADLIQLARQVGHYRRRRRFDLSGAELAVLADRVLRRDPADRDALCIRKLLQHQHARLSWNERGKAWIAGALWPDILVAEHSESTESQRLSAFTRLTPAAALGVLLGALACVALLWDAEHAWVAKIWLGCFFLVIAARVTLARRTRRRLVAKTVHPSDVTNLLILSMAFGVLWGALLLAAPHLDPSHDAVLPVVFVGACVMSGALTTYFVIPGASPTYAALVGVPLIYAGATHSAVIGLLAAVYTAWTIVSAIVHERLYTDSVDRTQALITERDKLDTALEAAPTGAGGWLWKTDAALQLRDVDPDLAEAHGTQAEALIGRPFLELFGDARRRTTGGPIAALGVTLALRKAFHGIRIISHDGRALRHWELSGSPRYAEDGCFIGYQGVCGEAERAQPAPRPLDDYADDLTGMPPLWVLRPRIEEALLKAQHGRGLCAATLIALDGLERLPKLAQHRATILLIAEAASRLRALAAGNEVAYLGSGRFLLFCDSFLRVDELVGHACNTVAKLSGRYDLDGAGALDIRALGGIALGPVECASTTVLLEHAASALGEAFREADSVHVYRRGWRPVASIDEIRAGLHASLRATALFPRYSVVLDIATRQPVAVHVDLVWEDAKFGRFDGAMIEQVATDIVTQRWLSDCVVGRILPEAWPVVGAAILSIDATLLDVTDAGLKTKLALVSAAARLPQAAIEVIVKSPVTDDVASATALDLAGPAILIGLRGSPVLAKGDDLTQPVTSLWLNSAASSVDVEIAQAKALYPNLRRVVAEGVEDAGALDRLASLGFTAFVGLPPLTRITADEAIEFIRPDKLRRSSGQSRIAS